MNISLEQPYRLKSDNHAQVAKDNQGDMSFHVNHISPCISPEENTENRAQNEQLRRSGDTGDIYLQHIIVILFLILWHIITCVPFLQLFAFRIFPVCIVIWPMP